MDGDGAPVPGVHVWVSGTDMGTVSNRQGPFDLKVPAAHCNLEMFFSHISYNPVSKKIECRAKDYAITLSGKTFELDEVQVYALSAERIILNSIPNLEKNYQVDSVNYTMFARVTEQIEGEPLLIE